MINPYEFLGVTCNDSLHVVKQRYYELSRLCHPDKGGSIDDMCALQSAYQFVKRELEYGHKNVSETHEALEALYDAFKSSFPVQRIPNYLDVIAETVGMTYEQFATVFQAHLGLSDVSPTETLKFYNAIRMILSVEVEKNNETILGEDGLWTFVKEKTVELWENACKETEMMHASIPHGYQDPWMMVPPLEPLVSFGKKELVIRQDVDPACTSFGTPTKLIPFNLEDGTCMNMYKALSDYSMYDRKLYDYRLAHLESDVTTIADSNEWLQKESAETFAEKVHQRQNERESSAPSYT